MSLDKKGFTHPDEMHDALIKQAEEQEAGAVTSKSTI